MMSDSNLQRIAHQLLTNISTLIKQYRPQNKKKIRINNHKAETTSQVADV